MARCDIKSITAMLMLQTLLFVILTNQEDKQKIRKRQNMFIRGNQNLSMNSSRQSQTPKID